MQNFYYKAVNTDGEVVEDILQGNNSSSIVQQLQREGLLPIEVIKAASAKRRVALQISLRRHITNSDTARLFQQLSDLLRAGITLDRSLSMLAETYDHPQMKHVLKHVHKAINEGSSLSSALQKHEGMTPMVIGMVKAGEISGRLEEALTRLAAYLEKTRELQAHIRASLTYPAILVCVSIISILVLIVYVVPNFEKIFSDAGQQLPLATRIVAGIGNQLLNYWWLIALVIITLVATYKTQVKKPQIRRLIDRRLLALPMFGELIVKINLSRFANTLGSLLQGGVGLLSALEMGGKTLSNSVLADDIDSARESIKTGRRLGASLLELGNFPILASQMINLGEETGALEDTLFQIAKTYEREAHDSINKLLSLTEPVIILGLGLIVGAIIMSILIAILDMNQLII